MENGKDIDVQKRHLCHLKSQYYSVIKKIRLYLRKYEKYLNSNIDIKSGHGALNQMSSAF